MTTAPRTPVAFPMLRARSRMIGAAVSVALVAGMAFATVSAAVAPASAATIDVGEQSGTHRGNVRGFWFTAPVDFVITGLDIPTDASTGNIDAVILRLNAPIPAFSATTTSYDVLYELRNSPVGASGLNIQISQNDIIGVLGYRGGVNSYAPASFASSVLGEPVTLLRFGTQNSLSSGQTVAGMGVFQETSGPIGRVTLSLADGTPAVIPLPATGVLLIGALGTLAGLRRRKMG